MAVIEISSELECGVPAPVSFAIPAGTPDGSLVLRDGNLRLPVQRADGQLQALAPPLKAGAKRRFRLEAGDVAGGVTVKPEGTHALALAVPEGPFATYRFNPAEARPYLWPVLGPDGVRMTRDFPMTDVPAEKEAKDQDHKHHRSLWTAYGEVNGTDDWSEEARHGWIRHTAFLARWEGPVSGGFTSASSWTSMSGEPLLEEKRTIRLYAAGATVRLLDYEVTLTPAAGDIHYGDTKEGGILAIRVFHSMKGAAGGKMENSVGGVGEKQCWGKRAAWLDYSGRLGDKIYGIGMLDHPGNLNHPCYWHARDYGLVGTNPFARAAFEGGQKREWIQKKGESLVFRYRLVLHRGDAREGGVDDAFHAWVQPPTVKVIR